MTISTIVRLSAEPTRTRLLMTQGGSDLCKASLPAMGSVHPRAASTLLEGLSLFAGERLAVVLCVDDQSPTSFAPALLDGLGYGTTSVYYDVAVAIRETRRERARRRRLEGIGDFRDLRQLDWGWAR
jgi:hypothetical protein